MTEAPTPQTSTLEAPGRDLDDAAAVVDAGRGLVAHALTKRWRGMEAPVLDGVRLVAPPGQITWIGGRNGSGKTTLLRILAGLIEADRGSVSVDGLSPQRDGREFRRRIGFVPAGNTGLYARLSPRRHLDYWARIAFVPPERRAGVIAEIVERFELGPILDRRCDRLSLGQRQRVRLAMAFVHEPGLVLLDEPGNSLDDEGKAVLAARLAEFARGGGTVVWCAPSRDAIDLPQRQWVLDGGRLVRR